MAYAQICVIPLCPNKSAVRISDEDHQQRRDMCKAHGITAIKINKGNVEIIDTWNGTTMEDYEYDA